MQEFKKIDFRVARDVGQVYNTAFLFLRQNRVVLFKSITYYIMPFILVAAFLVFSGIADFFSVISKGIEGNITPFVLSMVQGLVGVFFIYIAYTAYITLVYEFVYLYKNAEQPGQITHQDVWRATRKRFFKGLLNVFLWGLVVMAVSSVVAGVLYVVMIVGVLFAAIFSAPWLIFVFMVLFYILDYIVMFYVQSVTFPMVFLSAFERIDVFTALGRSFSAVNRKGNFWSAIGATFLGFSILWILHTNMVALPIGLIAGVFSFNDINPAETFDPDGAGYIVLFKVVLPLVTLAYFYTLCIYFVTQAFEILSLDEKARGAGLLERINRMGERKDVGPEFYDVSY